MALACGSVTTSSVRAQAAFELAVERAPAAETCPDSELLRARVEALRGAPASVARGRFSVAFARDGGNLMATLQHAEEGADNVRVLRAKGDSCAGLAEATAITLALLLDAEPPVSEPAPAAPPVEPFAAVPAIPERAAPASARASSSLRALVALGGAGVFGLMRASLPALLADVGIELRGVRLSLGALWSWPHRIAYGPGSLRESLQSGVLRACVPLLPGRWLRIDACSGAYVGAFEVQARGYSHDAQQKHLWLAAPVELALGLGTRALSLELALGAVFSAHRPDFTVAGIGTAYRSWPVSPLLSLRLFGAAPR